MLTNRVHILDDQKARVFAVEEIIPLIGMSIAKEIIRERALKP